MADDPEVQPSTLPEYHPHVTEKESMNSRRPQYIGNLGNQEVYKHERQDQWKRKYPLWAVVVAALIAATVVGAAVGGGVGSKLHNAQMATQQQYVPSDEELFEPS